MTTNDWDQVLGDLDVRTLPPNGRLDLINREIRSTLAGHDWTVLSGGDEGHLAWDAAVRTFVEGVWVATILCCHVVCEREVAGIVSLSRPNLRGDLPSNWQQLGLGGLIGLVRKHELLPVELADEVKALAEARRPYGHWRSPADPDSLFQRARREHELTGHMDWENLQERLIVRDATAAIRTTAHLYFGNYAL